MRSLELFVIASLIGLVGIAVWHGRQWFPAHTGNAGSAVASTIQPASTAAAKALHSRSARNSGHESAARDARSGNTGLNAGLQERVQLVPDASRTATIQVDVSPTGDPDSEKLPVGTDRKSTRLNSSHANTSY